MNEILIEFQSESKALIVQLMQILESVEAEPSLYKSLEQYGQIVDRIMGAAKSLNQMIPHNAKLETIGNFAALGKVIGYKASQVGNNEQLVTVAVALLLDATEVLGQLNDTLLETGSTANGELLSDTFLDRLKWLATKFDETLRATLAIDKSSAKPSGKAAQPNATGPQAYQPVLNEIDAVLKKLGVKTN
jgi:hypothetical protein